MANTGMPGQANIRRRHVRRRRRREERLPTLPSDEMLSPPPTVHGHYSVVYCNYADCLMADCFLSVYAVTSHSLVGVRSQRPNSNGIRASTTKRLLYSSICVEQALNLPNLLLQLTT